MALESFSGHTPRFGLTTAAKFSSRNLVKKLNYRVKLQKLNNKGYYNCKYSGFYSLDANYFGQFGYS